MVLMRKAIYLLLLSLLTGLAAVPAAAQVTPRTPAAPRTPRPAPRPVPRPAPRVTFGFLLRSGPPPVVMEVMPESPAERAGFEEGDVLIAVDGQTATVESVRDAAHEASPGEAVRFRVRRDGREREISVVPETGRFARGRGRDRLVVIDPDSIRGLVKLYLDGARQALELGDIKLDFDLDLDVDVDGEGPRVYRFHMDSLARQLREQLRGLEPQLRELEGMRFDVPAVDIDLQGMAVVSGARLTDLNDELARYFPGADGGALVLSVREGSAADRAGLEAGDVIVAYDGDAIDALRDLHRDLRRRGGSHELTVVRRGERVDLRLEAR
jgi:membrane-associated protease RseP (regulator of RpoE activity)